MKHSLYMYMYCIILKFNNTDRGLTTSSELKLLNTVHRDCTVVLSKQLISTLGTSKKQVHEVFDLDRLSNHYLYSRNHAVQYQFLVCPVMQDTVTSVFPSTISPMITMNFIH